MPKVLILLFICALFVSSVVSAEEHSSISQFGPGERASYGFFSPNAVRDPLRMNLEVSQKPDYSYFPARPSFQEFADPESPQLSQDSVVPTKLDEKHDIKDPVVAKLFSDFGDPRERAPIKAIDSAPQPFKGLMAALEAGREDIASLYAKQYINHLHNLKTRSSQIFDLTSHVTQVEKIEAEANDAEVPLKITEGADLPPDVLGQRDGRVLVYFFFNPTSQQAVKDSYTAERLFTHLKKEPFVRFVGMSIVPLLEEEAHSAVQQLSTSFPVRDGGDLAQSLQIRQFPAFAFVVPSTREVHIEYGSSDIGFLLGRVRAMEGRM